jgi:galactan 5-O-arabinofuranosyltransferase
VPLSADREPARPVRRIGGRVAVELRPVVISVGGAALATLAVRTWHPDPWAGPTTWIARSAAAATVVLVAVLALALRHAGRSRLAADLVVGSAGVVAVFLLAVELSGTPFLPFGRDVTFRMAAATRFAHTWRVVDYSYRGLPAAYPPLLPWLTGRAAALVHTPGWRALKAASYAALALIGPMSYPLWRRILPVMPAAVVSSSAVVAFLAYRPEEWLAAAVVLPWLFVVLETKASGWLTWRTAMLGVIGGILVPLYYFYFLPAVFIVLLAVGIHTAFRARIDVVAVLRVLAVTAVTSAWYWVPLLVSLLTSGHVSDGQTSYYFPTRVPPVVPPIGLTAHGALDWIGVGYVVVRFRAERVARYLAAVVVGSYAWILAGKYSSLHWHDTLVYWRAANLVVVAGLAAGALGVVGLLTLLTRLRVSVGRRELVAGALVIVVATGLATSYVDDLRASRYVAVAHVIDLPDGRQPEFPRPHTRLSRAPVLRGQFVPHGRVALPALSKEASTAALWHALGGSAADNKVVLSTRPSLEWYYPVFFFNAATPSYANAAAGYVERLRFVEHLARVSDPVLFARWCQDNPFQPIDAAVLVRGLRGRLIYVTSVDDFGHGTRDVAVIFRQSQFPPWLWHRVDVGPYVVATRLAPAT